MPVCDTLRIGDETRCGGSEDETNHADGMHDSAGMPAGPAGGNACRRRSPGRRPDHAQRTRCTRDGNERGGVPRDATTLIIPVAHREKLAMTFAIIMMLVIALCAIAVLVSVVRVIIALVRWPRLRRQAALLGLTCPSCGFDVRGQLRTLSSTCPECGYGLKFDRWREK